MNSLYCSVLPKFTELISDEFYKELVKTELTCGDDTEDNEAFCDLIEFEEVFSDHICIGKRFQKTLYKGHTEDEDLNHPPIALTDLALKLFSKAVPNYGLDLLDMDYVSSVSEATRVSPCAMILAMIYLERLQVKNNDYLETASPTGLFVVTMLVASKFLFEDDEDIVTNQIWAKALNMDVIELNSLEQSFLEAIDWKLYVETSEYFHYLSNIEKTIAIKQSSFRGWFTYSDIYSILQDYLLRKSLILSIKIIVKISAIATMGYIVTVASLLTTGGFILQERMCKHYEQIPEIHKPLSNPLNLELKPNLRMPLVETDDVEIDLNKLLNNIKDFHKSLKFKKQYSKQNRLSSNLKSVCSSLTQYQSLEKAFNTQLNFYNSKKKFVNHSISKFQMWPSKYKSSCIPVLIA